MKLVVTKKLKNYFIQMKAKTAYIKNKRNINKFDGFHVFNIKKCLQSIKRNIANNSRKWTEDINRKKTHK